MMYEMRLVTIWVAGEWLGRYVHPRGANFPKVDGLKSGGEREGEGSDESLKEAGLHLAGWRESWLGLFRRELLMVSIGYEIRMNKDEKGPWVLLCVFPSQLTSITSDHKFL